MTEPVSNETTRKVLRKVLEWIRNVEDGEEGVDYLNGQSDKYPGDGWRDLRRLGREIDRVLKSPLPTREPEGR